MTFLHVCLRLVSGSREVRVRPAPWAGARHASLHPTQRSRLHHCQVLPTEALRKPVSGSPLPVTRSAHRFPLRRASPLPQHQATGQRSLISLLPKPPPMVHEHPPLTHRETRSHTPALSHRPPADGNRDYTPPTTTSPPPSFYQPQLNYPYLSPAPCFWLASRLAGPALALCGGRSARGNQGFAQKIQVTENHPDMGQRGSVRVWTETAGLKNCCHRDRQQILPLNHNKRPQSSYDKAQGVGLERSSDIFPLALMGEGVKAVPPWRPHSL